MRLWLLRAAARAQRATTAFLYSSDMHSTALLIYALAVVLYLGTDSGLAGTNRPIMLWYCAIALEVATAVTESVINDNDEARYHKGQ